jgi:hypothetical protein
MVFVMTYLIETECIYMSMSIVKNHRDPSSTLSTNFNFPITNDIQSIDLKNQTTVNDDIFTVAR